MELRPIEKGVLPEDHYQYSYHRVSAYDPNMCSTARFSPPYSTDHHEIPDTGYENIILIPCTDTSNIQNLHQNQTIRRPEEPHHTYTVPPANQQYTNVFDEARIHPHHHLQQCSTETVYTSLEPRQPINSPQETYVSEIPQNVETTTTQIIVHRSPNGHLYQNYYVNEDVNESAMVELVPIESGVNVYQEQYNEKQVENLSSVEYNYHSKLPNNGELIEHLTETSFVHLEPSIINDQGQESFLTETYSALPPHNTGIGLHEKDPQRILLESTMSPLLAAVNDITQRDAELQSYLNQTLEKENNIELFHDNNDPMQLKPSTNSYLKKELRILRNKNKDLDTEECLMVVDKPVESRARASLPTNYLYFGNSTDNSNDQKSLLYIYLQIEI